jgi:hypothetical protein
MNLLDATNNRQVTDGSTVFFGDQVLINIKTRKGKIINIRRMLVLQEIFLNI